jgi:hypothetical protein
MNATGELETFRAHISELDDAESGRVRRAFIETFLNQAHPLFVDSIETLRQFSDGPAYTGYLWDFLRSPTVVDERELWTRIVQVGELFVMGDVHSSELIRVPDYWKFPNGTRSRADHEQDRQDEPDDERARDDDGDGPARGHRGWRHEVGSMHAPGGRAPCGSLRGHVPDYAGASCGALGGLSRRRRTRRRSWALTATTIVERLIAMAPTAIGRSIPHGTRTPAATGMATTL